MSTTTQKIREKYGTVVRFARLHDYPIHSVYQVLCGRTGKIGISGRILAHLKKEGLWVEPRKKR